MNTIMKRNSGNGFPVNSLSGFVDRMFQDKMSRFFDDGYWGFNGLDQNARIPTNVRETAADYQMEIMVPGLKKENFNLSVNGSMLTVSYQQQSESEQKDEGWIRKEFKQQSFSQNFTLNETIDPNNISARYEDGILYLTLPKKEEAKRISRSIQIQ